MIIGRDRAFKFIIIFLVIWLIFFITDFSRAKNGNDPIFCLSLDYSSSEDRDYIGVFYTIEKNIETDALSGEAETVYTMSPWLAKSIVYNFSTGGYF